MSAASSKKRQSKPKASSSSEGSRGRGRSSGHPNYQCDKLLDVIEAIEPLGPEHWKAAAKQYHRVSGEASEREYADQIDLKCPRSSNLQRYPAEG